jgi:plasmid maintenance system antidote protein VapI
MKKRKKFDLLLREREITAPKLAKDLGVTGQAVYGWVWGRGTPTPRNMIRLTKILNISAEEVLELFAENEE